jgi:hypothetical protein
MKEGSTARETVEIDLEKLSPRVHFLVVTAFSYSGQDLDVLEDASIYLANPHQRGTGPGGMSVLSAQALKGKGTVNISYCLELRTLGSVPAPGGGGAGAGAGAGGGGGGGGGCTDDSLETELETIRVQLTSLTYRDAAASRTKALRRRRRELETALGYRQPTVVDAILLCVMCSSTIESTGH